MSRTKSIIMLLAIMLVAATAAQAGARLSGPATITRHGSAQYRASGLAEGTYALKIRTRLTHGGQSLRCVAFLAAPRRAQGTATFKGTVPSRLQCATPGEPDGTAWQPATRSGRYELVACAAGPSAYACSAQATIATRQIVLR